MRVPKPAVTEEKRLTAFDCTECEENFPDVHKACAADAYNDDRSYADPEELADVDSGNGNLDLEDLSYCYWNNPVTAAEAELNTDESGAPVFNISFGVPPPPPAAARKGKV